MQEPATSHAFPHLGRFADHLLRHHAGDLPGAPDSLRRLLEALRDGRPAPKIGPLNGPQWRHILRQLIPSYTQDIEVVLSLAGEMDALAGGMAQRQPLWEETFTGAEKLANIGSWSWDIATGALAWSDQLYRIYGLEPQSEVITLERFLSFVHPDDRERIASGLGLSQQQDSADYTFRIRLEDGTVKALRSLAVAHRGGDGKILRITGTEQDVTEHRALLEELRQSELLYRQAQALAKVGNWHFDVGTGTVSWSDELYRIYGLEPQSEAIDFEKYRSFIHPEDLPDLSAKIGEALRNGTPYEVYHRILLRNGGVRVAHSFGEAVLDPGGRVIALFGTAQDVTEREEMIRRLQESERLSRQAQSMARLGNWRLDLATRTMTWSEEMFRIYESAPRTEVGLRDFLGWVAEEEREAIWEYHEMCLRNELPYDRKHHIRMPDGRIKVVHRSGEMERDEEGRAIAMVGTTQDITEREALFTKLEENRMFIRKIADATPSIISTWRVKDGSFSFLSEGVNKLLGYPSEEVSAGGLSFLQALIHPEDLDKVARSFSSLVQEAADGHDQTAEVQFRIRHRNGQWKWLHSYGTVFDRNARGRVEQILNIALDVTSGMEAAERIREQDHFISHVADASPTILYMYDISSAGIQYANREVYFVLGYRPEELIAMGASVTDELYHPEDRHLLPGRPGSTKNFHQADTMMQYECRIRNRSGEWVWMLVREIVFRTGEEGTITQILGAALDISKRKEMERTILQNAFQLEQSNASLEEFAYVASHDLKEPLRKISTFGDRLVASQEAQLSPEGKIYLSKIVDASQRMQTMINDLLSISMISGNRSFERASLQELLEEALQTLEYKLERSEAMVESDGLPDLEIIPSQFRQLFQNLLSNSLKFVRDEVPPRIRIRHRYIAPGEEELPSLPPAPRYLRIDIEDNGIGFENEYAGKIFAIFQRLHGRSEYEGSGIGLAICKKIVEHHKGIIYAQGEPGSGATFTFILPA